jgi:hypothetical protein
MPVDNSFQPMATYPFEERKQKRGVPNAVAEFALDYEIAYIRKYVLRVERRRGQRLMEVVWKPERA